MRILVATDAWKPQTNGVVRTLEQVAREAGAFGAEIQFFTPEGFRSVPLPGYPEVRLALVHQGRVDQAIEAQKPDYLHIATEGPIGLAARRWASIRASPTIVPLTVAQSTASHTSTSGSAGFSGGFLPVAARHEVLSNFFASAAAASADTSENKVQAFETPTAMTAA